jgi:chromosome partitioning protein
MPVVAVFNQKGGVGKTTTTLNVAAALLRDGTHPILLDLDPQAHLTLTLGLRNVPADSSLYAFFEQGRPLLELTRTLPGGMRLVPASADLSKIEAQHGSDPGASRRLERGLGAGFAHNGEPVLLDCSPALGMLALNALVAADRVLLPVSADFLSVEGAHRLSATLDVLEQRLGKRFHRRVVVTRFDARRRLSYDIYDMLVTRFGDQVCETAIAETVALAESPMHGKDIFSHAGNSQGAADYRALTDELRTGNFFN